MDILIIYASIHHGNTEKIAQAIHGELGGKLVSFTEVKEEDAIRADLIGFGSGVYMAKFHKSLLNFTKKLPNMTGKKSFIFSTAGIRRNIFLNRGHRSIKKILEQKGFKTIGEFDCPGYDSYGLLRFIGGINKERPSDQDKEEAKVFARNIKLNLRINTGNDL